MPEICLARSADWKIHNAIIAAKCSSSAHGYFVEELSTHFRWQVPSLRDHVSQAVGRHSLKSQITRSSFLATAKLAFGYNPLVTPSCERLKILLLVCLVCLAACSPRDFLTRRLAADLIAGSDAFKDPQQFWLRTGVMSNKDYLSPDYFVLERHGWISGTNTGCPADISPPPVGMLC